MIAAPVVVVGLACFWGIKKLLSKLEQIKTELKGIAENSLGEEDQQLKGLIKGFTDPGVKVSEDEETKKLRRICVRLKELCEEERKPLKAALEKCREFKRLTEALEKEAKDRDEFHESIKKAADSPHELKKFLKRKVPESFGGEVKKLFEQIQTAAKKGVNVELALDGLTKALRSLQAQEERMQFQDEIEDLYERESSESTKTLGKFLKEKIPESFGEEAKRLFEQLQNDAKNTGNVKSALTSLRDIMGKFYAQEKRMQFQAEIGDLRKKEGSELTKALEEFLKKEVPEGFEDDVKDLFKQMQTYAKAKVDVKDTLHDLLKKVDENVTSLQHYEEQIRTFCKRLESEENYEGVFGELKTFFNESKLKTAAASLRLFETWANRLEQTIVAKKHNDDVTADSVLWLNRLAAILVETMPEEARRLDAINAKLWLLSKLQLPANEEIPDDFAKQGSDASDTQASSEVTENEKQSPLTGGTSNFGSPRDPTSTLNTPQFALSTWNNSQLNTPFASPKKVNKTESEFTMTTKSETLDSYKNTFKTMQQVLGAAKAMLENAPLDNRPLQYFQKQMESIHEEEKNLGKHFTEEEIGALLRIREEVENKCESLKQPTEPTNPSKLLKEVEEKLNQWLQIIRDLCVKELSSVQAEIQICASRASTEEGNKLLEEEKKLQQAIAGIEKTQKKGKPEKDWIDKLEETQSLQKKLEKARGDLASQKGKAAQLTRDLADKDAQLQEQKAKAEADLASAQQGAKAQITQLEADIVAKDQQLKAINDELLPILQKEEFVKFRREQQDQKELGDAEKEVLNIKALVEYHQSLQKRCEGLKKSNANLTEVLDKNRGRIQGLEKDLAQEELARKEFEQELETANDCIKALNESGWKLERVINGLKEELARGRKIQEELAQWKELEKEFAQQWEKLKQEEKLEREKQARSESEQKLESHIQQLEEQKKTLGEELGKEKEDKETFRKQLEESQSKAEELKQDLNGKITQLEEEKTDLQGQISDVREQLAEKEVDLEAQTNKYQQLQTEKAALAQSAAEITEFTEKLETEKEEKQKKVEELTKTLSQEKQNRESFEEQLKKAIQVLQQKVSQEKQNRESFEEQLKKAIQVLQQKEESELEARIANKVKAIAEGEEKISQLQAKLKQEKGTEKEKEKLLEPLREELAKLRIQASPPRGIVNQVGSASAISITGERQKVAEQKATAAEMELAGVKKARIEAEMDLNAQRSKVARLENAIKQNEKIKDAIKTTQELSALATLKVFETLAEERGNLIARLEDKIEQSEEEIATLEKKAKWQETNFETQVKTQNIQLKASGEAIRQLEANKRILQEDLENKLKNLEAETLTKLGLQEQVEQLKENITEIEGKAKEAIAALEGQISDIRAQLKQKEVELEAERVKLQYEDEKAVRLSEETNRITEALQKKQDELGEKETRCSLLEQRLNKLEESLRDAIQEAQQLEGIQQILAAENQAQAPEVKKKGRGKGPDVGNSPGEHSPSSLSSGATKGEGDNSAAQLTTLTKWLKEQNSQMQRLKNDLEKKAADLQRAEEREKDLQGNENSLSSQLKERTERANQLELGLTNASRQIMQLEAQTSTLKLEMESVEGNLRLTKASLQSEIEAKAELENQMSDIKTQLAQKEAHLKAQTSKYKQLQGEKEELHNKAEKTKSQLKDKISKITEELKEKGNKLDNLRNEASLKEGDAAQQITRLNEDVTAKKREIGQLVIGMKQLAVGVEKREEEILQREEHIARLQQESVYQKLLSSVDTLIKQNQGRKRTDSEIQRELEAKSSEVQDSPSKMQAEEKTRAKTLIQAFYAIKEMNEVVSDINEAGKAKSASSRDDRLENGILQLKKDILGPDDDFEDAMKALRNDYLALGTRDDYSELGMTLPKALTEDWS